jgi:hypothetical protein
MGSSVGQSWDRFERSERLAEPPQVHEEAVLNSLFAATTTRGFAGHVVEALPVDRVLEILRSHNALATPPPPKP